MLRFRVVLRVEEYGNDGDVVRGKANGVAAVSIATDVNAEIGVDDAAANGTLRENHDGWNGLDDVLGGTFFFLVLTRTFVVYRLPPLGCNRSRC